MQYQKKTLTQSEELGQRLKDLNADVTANDRISCHEELGYSKSTISNYLNGRVSDNDTAVALIQYFTQRIESRYEAIPPAKTGS